MYEVTTINDDHIDHKKQNIRRHTMKRIALLTTVGLALFATAAFAHQYRGGHTGRHGAGFSHVQQQSGYWGGGCPMNNGGMMYGNRGMMNHNWMHRGRYNTARPGAPANWRANPAYQGQATTDPSVD